MLVVIILNLKVQEKSFYTKNMRHTFLNSKSCRNHKLCIYLSEKSRRYVVLVANFCFANLKATNIESYPTDSNSAHRNYVKISG